MIDKINVSVSDLYVYMGSYKSVTYTEIDIYRDLTGISYYGFELNQI